MKSAAEKELERLRCEQRKAKRESEEHRNGKEREFRKALEAEMEQLYGERLRSLNLAVYNAEQVVEEEREKAALSADHEIPPGTILKEWHYERYGRDKAFTGRRGVVEVVTAESEHPGWRSYGLASRGDLVIRMLKKDGSRGKSYVRMDNYESKYWVAEATTEQELRRSA